MSNYIEDDANWQDKIENAIKTIQNRNRPQPLQTINTNSGMSGIGNKAGGPVVGTSADTPTTYTPDINGAITLISTNVLLDGVSTIHLKTINGVIKDGTRIQVKAVAGKSFILDNGGNINIAAPTPAMDSKSYTLMTWYKETSLFDIISSGSAAAGGLWSNVNIDITKDMLRFGLIDLFSIGFVNANNTIYTTNSQMIYQVNNGAIGAHQFTRSDFITLASLDINGIDFHNGNALNIVDLKFGTSQDLLSGSAGIDYKLPAGQAHRFVVGNIVTATIDSTGIIPGATKTIGNETNFWTGGFFAQLDIGGIGNFISRDGGNNMILNVPATKQITIEINTGGQYQFLDTLFSAPLADFQPRSLSLQGGFLIFLQTGDPLIDGIMGVNAGDIEAFTGGNLKNLSQMPQLNATNTFSGVNTINNLTHFTGPSLTTNVIDILGSPVLGIGQGIGFIFGRSNSRGNAFQFWYNHSDVDSNRYLNIAPAGVSIPSQGIVINGDGTLQIMLSAAGGGTAAFGVANCPAVTPTSVHQWIKIRAPDGSVAYMPCWK